MIVVDSSSIISLAVNCLCPVLELLDVEIAATPSVFHEIVTKPSTSKKFSLESMRIQKLFNDQIVKVYDADPDTTKEFMNIANGTYTIKHKPLKIIHKAEAECVILANEKNAGGLLMDERTLRLMMEDPEGLRRLLSHRNKKEVRINEDRLTHLQEIMPKIPVIRSTEIIAIAYEKGILGSYMNVSDKKLLISSLNALKLSGCAIGWDEIDEYDKLVI